MKLQLMKPQLLTINEPTKPTLASINTATKIIMKTLEENQVTASDKLFIARDLYHQTGIEILALSHALLDNSKAQKQAILRAPCEELKEIFESASAEGIQTTISEVMFTKTSKKERTKW